MESEMNSRQFKSMAEIIQERIFEESEEPVWDEKLIKHTYVDNLAPYTPEVTPFYIEIFSSGTYFNILMKKCVLQSLF